MVQVFFACHPRSLFFFALQLASIRARDLKWRWRLICQASLIYGPLSRAFLLQQRAGRQGKSSAQQRIQCVVMSQMKPAAGKVLLCCMMTAHCPH